MQEEKLTERIDPKHAAVLIIDVQNDFAHPEGALGRRGIDMTRNMAIVPQLQRLIDGARRAGAPIVFVRTEMSTWTNSEAWVGSMWEDTEYSVCDVGGWGAEYYKVTPEPDDYIVTKNRYSGFQDTNLDLVLRSIGVRTIICTGLVTNVCVESTARQGYMLDYHVVFVDDCSDTTVKEEHEATLVNIRKHFGIVAKSAEVLKAWGVK